MTTPEIRELDPQTVERIAAGEVVERPASVVKELLENSIDAGASRVTVSVDSGGTEGIRVTDDGRGMARDELERAVEKHTTSKIRDVDDLESGVATLGFRGEALHAIGAVSRMTITSRSGDGGAGTELVVEGGEITDISPAGRPPGTTVDVQDLFYNVPARRKYLKQDSTEFAHVQTVTTSYALANPDVAVTLEHGDRETFATTGSGNLRDAVLAVYGREVAEAMRPIPDHELEDGPLESVEGLVSHPETNRSTRDYLATFVNGRYVTATSVREAIADAYDTQLAPDRYPFAVLFLEVDPATVDVNVHPRKLEVRFADEEGVRDQVRTAVQEALLGEGLLRSSAPRGRSAAEQTEIQPDSGGETSSQEASQQHPSSDPDGSVPDAESHTSTDESGEQSDSRRVDSGETVEDRGGGSDMTEAETEARTQESAKSEARTQESAKSEARTQESAKSEARTQERAERDNSETEVGKLSTTERRGKFRDSGRQERLGDADDGGASFEQLPSMRILGQFEETYIVGETDDGLVLIDQHAADERINYERLRASFSGDTTTQALAEPVRVELTAQEASLFDSHSAALSRIGFQASLIDERTVEVRTVPTRVAESAGPELIRDVLSEFVSGSGDAAETVEAAVDDLLADLACYPSITGNTSLMEGSVVELLSTLDDCENPYACPHGRPVIVEFDTEEIEARFERDYPGHH